MWKPGEIVAWRGIYRGRVWHAQSTIVIQDKPEEIVVALLPGTECIAEKDYLLGKTKPKRRWNYKEEDWVLSKYTWRTNRLLAIVEPEKFYSIMLFWNHDRNEFIGYYVNFQLPFQRSHCGINTLDLDLDIDIEPDLSFRWKDEDDYQLAIEHGVIDPEWVQSIDVAKHEVLDRLERRQYPFDGSWLNWMPDLAWSPPKLPANWDKI